MKYEIGVVLEKNDVFRDWFIETLIFVDKRNKRVRRKIIREEFNRVVKLCNFLKELNTKFKLRYVEIEIDDGILK